MPSFDVVSEIDHHELTNALDQANREIGTRYDFKGSGARIEVVDNQLMMHAQSKFQLQQMLDILRQKLAKRGMATSFSTSRQSRMRILDHWTNTFLCFPAESLLTSFARCSLLCNGDRHS